MTMVRVCIYLSQIVQVCPPLHDCFSHFSAGSRCHGNICGSGLACFIMSGWCGGKQLQGGEQQLWLAILRHMRERLH
jgi:hypothetical protein